MTLTLPSWGGARAGAGRKRRGAEPPMPRDAREPFTRAHPVHVTLRVREHVWNLRSERSFAVVLAALERVRLRPDFAVAHFAVQGNVTARRWTSGGADPRPAILGVLAEETQCVRTVGVGGRSS